MEISPQTSVGELVQTVPGAELVFEVVGIDSCCKPERSLADACTAAGLEVNEVMTLLSGMPQQPWAPPPVPATAQAPLAQVTSGIRDHYHRRARRALVVLIRLARRLCGSHGQTFKEIWTVRDEIEELARELVPHMQNEERYLFPYIAGMDGGVLETETVIPLFGKVEHPLRQLKHDHSDDLAAIAKLREVTRNFTPPDRSCSGFRDLYTALAHFAAELQEHIDLENDTLFPRAVERETELFQKGRT